MAYQTGTATGPADLLDKLRAFLLANGWTIDAWRFQVGQPTWRWLAFSKSGFVFHIYELLLVLNAPANPTTSHFGLRWSDTYNSGVDYSGQTPNHGETYCADIVGPYSSYHFFEGVGRSGPYVYCAVELGVGEFRHFGVGVLDKVGTYTGGQFVFGTRHDISAGAITQPITAYDHAYPFDDGLWTSSAIIGSGSTRVRCDDSLGAGPCVAMRDAPAGQQLRCGALHGRQQPTAGAHGSPNAAFWGAGPLASIAVSPLIRVPCFAERGTADVYALIGEPPNFRHFNMRFNVAGDEITLGTETWKVFPIVRKGSGGAVAVSGELGIAYRKS